MRYLYEVSVFVIATVVIGCAGRLPVVGYDKEGRPTMARISEGKYAEHLAESLVSAQDSTLPALNTQTEEEKEWKLRTAMRGVARNVSAALGPCGIGIKPRIRAALANGEKPPIP